MVEIGPQKEVEIEPFPETAPQEEPSQPSPAPAQPAPSVEPSKEPVPA